MFKSLIILKYQFRLQNIFKDKNLIKANQIIQSSKSLMRMQRSGVFPSSIFFPNNIGKCYFSSVKYSFSTKDQAQKMLMKKSHQQYKKWENIVKDMDIKDPKNHKAFLNFAALNGAVGDHQKCISLCNQILNSNPQRIKQLLCYLTLAITYKQTNQSQKAIEYLRKVQPEASKYPQLVSFYSIMSKVLFSQNKFLQAAKYSEMHYNINNKDIQNIYQIGLCYYWANKTDKLQQWAKKAVNQFPNNIVILQFFGQLKSKIGKFNEANQLFDKAIQIEPQNNNIYVLKIQSLIHQGKSQQALKFFRKTSAQRPQIKNNANFSYIGGVILHAHHLYQESISELLKLTVESNHFDIAQIVLGNCYLAINKFDEALKHFLKATKLKRNQNNVSQGFIGVGTCQYAKGNKEKAIQYYDKAITIQPFSFDAHIRKAILLHQMGKFKESIPHYKKAVEINPNQINAWLNIGHYMLQTGNFSQAINCYDKFLAVHPEDKQCLSSKSFCLMSLRRLSEARPILENIINDYPTFENHYNLALCHRMFYDIDKAEACLKKALQIQPGRIQAINAIKQIQELRKNEGNL